MLPTQNISNQLKETFIKAIANRIGIKIRDSEKNILEQKIWQRTTALKLSKPKQYYQFLTIPSLDSEQEWQYLSELLTNNESYFFRDRQQLNLLKYKILPQIIKQKRQQKSLNLRIWSAGCSTGQEPYSLAIILKEILPDINFWDLSIFGTDIDRQALSQARGGIYSEWSFRDTEPRIKEQYFESKGRGDSYQIASEIREMVKFQKTNLVSEQFPQLFSQLRDIDLIVCRNVFIYFSSSTIGSILEKFYHTLQPSGYLLVGHSELANQNLSRFRVQVFPQSLIYQRRGDSLTNRSDRVSPPPASQPSPTNIDRLPRSSASTEEGTLDLTRFSPPKSRASKNPAKAQSIQPQSIQPQTIQSQTINLLNTIDSSLTLNTAKSSKLLATAEHLWRQKQSHLAIKKASEILAIQPQNISACCLLGKIYLELNLPSLATDMSNRALAIEPLNLDANYLLGEIILKQGNRDAAKKALKKILSLDPKSIKALMELSFIYQQEKDQARADKMKQQAIAILQSLPNTKVLPTCNNLTVAELIFQLQTKIL